MSLGLILAVGCQFAGDGGGDTDAGSSGETSATGTGQTAGEASSTTPTTQGDADDTTAEVTSTTSEATSTAGESTSTAGDSGTTADACPPFALWLWASNVPPEDTSFQLSEASELAEFDGEPVMFFRSSVDGAGRAAFAFDLPCADTVMLWGLTWDALGADTSNADAYEVGVDIEPDDASERWEYGCDNDARGWGWYPVRGTGERCAADDPLEPELEAGPHVLRLRNPEDITNNPQFDFTGIAAVVVTNDPNYDPSDEYDPSPPR